MKLPKRLLKKSFVTERLLFPLLNSNFHKFCQEAIRHSSWHRMESQAKYDAFILTLLKGGKHFEKAFTTDLHAQSVPSGMI